MENSSLVRPQLPFTCQPNKPFSECGHMVVRHSPVVNGKGGEIEKLHGNAVKHYNRKPFHAHYSNLEKVIDMHRKTTW